MSYKEQMQRLWGKYEELHGREPNTIQDCFDWAYRAGLWKPRPLDISKIFNKEMADALRQETRIDESGRKYRAKICIKEKTGGVQMTLWADADKASEKFVKTSVQQRRNSVIGDCHKLKQDVEHFNEFRNPDKPINLILDFTDDVAEHEALTNNSTYKNQA